MTEGHGNTSACSWTSEYDGRAARTVRATLALVLAVALAPYGSVGTLADDLGDVVERYTYDPYVQVTILDDQARSGIDQGDDAFAQAGTAGLDTAEAGNDHGCGPEVLAEYDVTTDGISGFDETLERWFIHGQSFPDPLVMVDLSEAGDLPAGHNESLYYLKDALGSVGALAERYGTVVERYGSASELM